MEEVPPHCSLGNQTPSEFALLVTPGHIQDGDMRLLVAVRNASPACAMSFGSEHTSNAALRAATVSGHSFARRGTPVFGRGNRTPNHGSPARPLSATHLPTAPHPAVEPRPYQGVPPPNSLPLPQSPPGRRSPLSANPSPHASRGAGGTPAGSRAEPWEKSFADSLAFGRSGLKMAEIDVLVPPRRISSPEPPTNIRGAPEVASCCVSR